MTPITKQHVEELIDRLASKELTFGCRLVSKNPNDTKPIIMTSRESWNGVKDEFSFVREEYPNNFGLHRFDLGIDESLKHALEKEFEILGHPILIGDVLEKMSKQDKVFELREVCKFLEAWEMCVTEEERAHGKAGLTKSLQEIAEGIEWDKGDCFGPDCVCRGQCEDSEVAKPSPATGLLLFIHQLGL